MSHESRLNTAIAHLGRFAFLTRDNPYVSALPSLAFPDEDREALIGLLEGTIDVGTWLGTSHAEVLSDQVNVRCLPRDLQLVSKRGKPGIGIESAHGFLQAPLFWWVVSILWCVEIGRFLDPELDDDILGYRLHRDFLATPSEGGTMFRNSSRAFKSWSRFGARTADASPGTVFASTTLDIKNFYYSVTALPSTIVAMHRGSTASAADCVPTDPLAALLDHLHEAYALKLRQVRPRDVRVDAQDQLPLPVGLPSSQVLGNLVVDQIRSDIVMGDGVVAVAAYADDLVVVSEELPALGEATDAYLERIGVVVGDEFPRLNVGHVSELVFPEAQLEKSGAVINHTRAVGQVENSDRSETADAIDVEIGDLDPYLEGGDTDADEWDGRLSTTLKASHRRERIPRDLRRRVNLLLGEVRVGTPRTDVEKGFSEIRDSLDAYRFIGIRGYWREIIVCGIAARGIRAVFELTALFEGVTAQLSVPAGAAPGLAASLREGLREAWVQSVAGAIAVATDGATRNRLANGRRKRLFSAPEHEDGQTIQEVCAYASAIRERRLIPGTLVCVPLAEFTDWDGALIGGDSFADFIAWADRQEEESFGENSPFFRAVRHSVRFIALHEVCLAVHLWADRSSSDWVATSFGILGAQPLVRPELTFDLLHEALNAVDPDRPRLIGATGDQVPPSAARRVAMPSMRVDSTQLDRVAGGNRRANKEALIAIRRAARAAVSEILRAAHRQRAQFLVLPEWAVPTELLPWLMYRAANRQMVVVAGETPVLSGSTYRNRLWTGIPLEDAAGHRSCLVPPPREKTELSPAESVALQNVGWSHADSPTDPPVYRWKDVRFGSLICFEFADMRLRHRLKRKVDLITVSSLNQDWRYFDAIQDSTTRDSYCITVCVNTGSFPGTRMMRPTGSERSVAAAVHGSDHPAVVTRSLDFAPIIYARVSGKHPLANGQFKLSAGKTLSDGIAPSDYKPLPPGW